MSNENVNTTPLLKRASMFLEEGDWGSADKYCENVLDLEPECAEAYLIKLLAELKLKNREEFKKSTKAFEESNNYQKIMQFADEELKKDFIKDVFSCAENKMKKAKKESEYKAAMKSFTALSEFMKIDEQIGFCKEKIKKIRKKKTKIVITVAAILCVVITIVAIWNPVIKPFIDYNKAIGLMEDEKYYEAIEAFEQLNGYKDSENKINECNSGIIEAKYKEAILLIDSGKYFDAITTFDELGNYKDSVEKAEDAYIKYRAEILKTAKVGDYVLFGSYEQNIEDDGNDYIEWLVLEVKNNKALIISKKVLEAGYYASGDTIWQYSSVRYWLNDDFINSAFTADERTIISSTKLPIEKNPEAFDSTHLGYETTDKVFLLSISEAEKYFSSNETRQCKATQYAAVEDAILTNLSLGTETVPNTEEGASWFLRTPGTMNSLVTYVAGDGEILKTGCLISIVPNGIRPAMWIDLSKVK